LLSSHARSASNRREILDLPSTDLFELIQRVKTTELERDERILENYCSWPTAITEKYHNFEKDRSVFMRMLKTNSCYVYKDYLNKYEDTQVIPGADFDTDLFESDLPDEAMQALLQAAVPTITLSPIWANHEAKWREFSPNDLSVNGCHRYLAHRFYIAKDLDPVLDPRKLQQLIAVIFRHTHGILVQNRGWEKWAEDLENERIDNLADNWIEKQADSRKRAREWCGTI